MIDFKKITQNQKPNQSRLVWLFFVFFCGSGVQILMQLFCTNGIRTCLCAAPSAGQHHRPIDYAA
ncbi:MAG: hypothetical protein B7X64_03130 [Halothiobacillus sp. 39-53-45]|nr:MAG: hypothetical protein B7X64_03130 [Halothiobacillus sp. 39-53-45]